MSFLCGMVSSAYHGACRNSFNATVSSYFLNSDWFKQMAKTADLAEEYMPQELDPCKMFIFGAVAGATKGLTTELLEATDRSTLNIQKNYGFIFKICALGVAFFTAYKATAYFSERLGYPGELTHSVMMVESVDLMHQLLFYKVKPAPHPHPHWGRRV
ncbi:hypothetical protein [Simkania sp.]|uniref:hypothetical protein n=1 Tax=Simkania sp. TaxID=34094 RepID=UPI003B51ACE0